jgi:hypothetical protein
MAHCDAAEAAGKALGLVWETSGRDCYMGIDQMGGWNAVIIKRRLPDGRQAVVQAKGAEVFKPGDAVTIVFTGSRARVTLAQRADEEGS